MTPRSSERIRRAAVAVLGLSLALGACSHDPVAAPAQEPLTSLPRALTSDERAVIAGSNRFAFGLMRAVTATATPDSNVFISPLSASMALGMATNGTAGETQAQMRATLGFDAMSLEQVNAAYRELIALLRSIDRGVDFRIANSVWTRQDFPIRPEFLERTRASFDAESQSLDFGAPSSVDVINAWVKASTNGKIPTIVEEIPPDMVAYLINAIYFKGSWRSRFDAARTSPAPFTSAGGTTRMAPAMNQTHDFAWYRGNGFEAVDLPYSRGAFSMTVILPDPGSSPAAVLERLDPDTWAQLAAFPTKSEVALRLPKFTLEDEHGLIPALQALGMRDAFDDSRADFSLLSPVGGLMISEVKQKTFVDVHEEGTEAAAVTSVGIIVTSAPQQRPFVVDRPFLFVLRERFSGAILFMGRIGRLPVR